MSQWADLEVNVHTQASYFGGQRWRSILLFLAALRAIAGSDRRFDVAHVHLTQRGSFVREGLVLGLARRRCRIVTATIHGSNFPGFATRHSWLVRKVLSVTDDVFVLTDEARLTLMSLGVPSMLISNMVSPSVGDAHNRARANFIFAGEVGRRKGIDVLLEAWGQGLSTSDRLILLGELERGYQLPDPLPPSVEYLGYQPRSVVRKLLSGTLVAVLPSRAEAMPMFILEAMCEGNVVVVSDVGQAAKTVDGTGVVLRENNADHLRQTLEDLAKDRRRAVSLGMHARKRIESEYSQAPREAVVHRWCELLAAGPPRSQH